MNCGAAGGTFDVSILEVGYRDGLAVGKEATAQEGFTIEFEESVVDGYNWGLVRGVTRWIWLKCKKKEINSGACMNLCTLFQQ
ncbi:hypothetical protein F0562_013416 [Nyssa sinensis]|uniref:Essential protein Yae1 N-terminal domain-containing protein n=1 Tax=Nyssa sinensis TaxID=561372 RepID=A0A5J4ZKE6_9ASTE|nr:hypothetical protein F0562_013416 [Nyssa sinensis]